MKKLLIIGSNTIHTYNYIELVKGYFDDVLLITNERRQGFFVKSLVVDFHLRPTMFKAIRGIRRVADDYSPDVVHVHQANSYAFISLYALKNYAVPKVLTAWGSDILLVPELNHFYRKMVQYALDKADVITSDSLYMSNRIRELCTSQPTIVSASFGIEPTEVSSIKENIVFTNRLHKRFYNIDMVIIAFEKFVKSNRDWRLVVAGTGEDAVTRELVDLTKLLQIEDSVQFTGWLDSEENLDYYRRSKIYISIPDSDATSISLLEAISNDCVCFVSNLPANCEHILDHVNGFIEDDLANVDLHKHHQIDSQLQSSVNSLRSRFYDKGYCREIFYGIYDDLISDRGTT